MFFRNSHFSNKCHGLGGPLEQLGVKTLNVYSSAHMWDAFLENVLWNISSLIILLFAPMHYAFMHTLPIYAHSCMHTHTHSCLHTYAHPCMHMYACTHAHWCMHTHAHTCIHTHHTHSCTHMHAHTCTCTSMHAHTCMHTLITWLRIHGQGAHTFKHKEGIIHTLTTEHTKVHGLCNGSGFSYVISVSWRALQACTTGCWRNPGLKPETSGQSLQKPLQTKSRQKLDTKMDPHI